MAYSIDEWARKRWMKYFTRTWILRNDARCVMQHIADSFPRAGDMYSPVYTHLPRHFRSGNREQKPEVARLLSDISEAASERGFSELTIVHDSGFTAQVIVVVTQPGEGAKW